MSRVEEIEHKKATSNFIASIQKESYHLEDISITLARICDALELLVGKVEESGKDEEE